MALHPYRQDYQEFAPDGYQPTHRMTRLFDALIDRHALVDNPALTTLVCTLDRHDRWTLKLTMVLDATD